MIKNMEWGAVAYLKQSKYGLGINDLTNNDNGSYYTGGGSDLAYKNNTNQSTTGNIYGVYDMKGNAYDYMMASIVNNNGEIYTGSSGFINVPEAKYYDKYTYGSNSSSHARGKLGDATKETLSTFGNTSGGWYGSYAFFPRTNNTCFFRGGLYNNGANTGIFALTYSDCGAGNTRSTRVILS